jgi:16S rRNA A1518/A1519 N6-dimethyltransferase RsmA/KsgA/DIM1 with predicted DNA glycosylase/AP lyase activity
MTDTIPCPYYFIHKISQFINKKKIKSVIDLGSGYGRITNFLDDSTKAKIIGHELDKDVFDISKKNKKTKVNLENKNILNIDYKDLKLECFILNDPLHNKTDLEYLIKKIQSNMNNFKEKYYLVSINIEKEKAHVFNDYKLLKLISAGQLRSVRFYGN